MSRSFEGKELDSRVILDYANKEIQSQETNCVYYFDFLRLGQT